MKLLLRKASRAPHCPDCGAEIRLPRISEEALWDTRVDCPACGAVMSVMAAGLGQRLPGEIAAGLHDVAEVQKPASSRIEVREGEGARMWRVPAKGGCGSLMIFGTVWTAFSGVMAILFLFAESDDGSIWLARLFISFFVLIGLVFIYAGLRMTRSEHWLLIQDETVAHERHFLGRAKRTTLSRASISFVDLTVFYEENYKPVHGIEIRGAEGKIKFGSALAPDEKAWLLGEVRRALGQWEAAPDEPASAGRDSTSNVGGSMKIEETDGQCVVSTMVPGKGAVPAVGGGIFFALVAGFMMWDGPARDLFSDDIPMPMTLFVLGFCLIWYGGLSVFVMIGLSIAAVGWSLRGGRQVVTANRHGLSIVLERRQRKVSRHWALGEVGGIAVREATTAYDQSRTGEKKFRIEVALPDRICGVGLGETKASLAAAAAALSRGLGRSIESEDMEGDAPRDA